MPPDIRPCAPARSLPPGRNAPRAVAPEQIPPPSICRTEKQSLTKKNFMPNDFTTISIEGVLIRSLQRYDDRRGWLTELFRADELPGDFTPAMGYISMTRPGVARGPHEHRCQTDGFAFMSGRFEITLWENRPGRDRLKWVLQAGEETPLFLIVPPGVVHAYRNVGDSDALVFNFPDRLYAGKGRAETVDEIRHEDIDSEFQL